MDEYFEENPTVCEECGWVNHMPKLSAGQLARCERCGHALVKWPKNVLDKLISFGSSAVLMLILAVSFDFLGFSVKGNGLRITLPETATTLIGHDYRILAALLCLALFVIPLCYLLSVVYLSAGLKLKLRMPGSAFLSHLLTALQPWLMVDVFLAGALVSLVKLSETADISLGPSFWALCAYALLLLKTASLLDRRWLWRQIRGKAPAFEHLKPAPARSLSVSGCRSCGAVVPREHVMCGRCGRKVHGRSPAGLQPAIALLLAAAVMYVPANMFPVMKTVFLGDTDPSTIVGGVILFWRSGSYPVAVIIFAASVLIPLAKIISLLWLCRQCRRPVKTMPKQKAGLFFITDVIGRWSMIDVFVVAVLAGLVRLGSLMSMVPGPAALSFAAVVILTMLAAMYFDPSMLWDSKEAERKESV